MFELVRNKGFQTRIDALKTVEYFVFFRQEITGYKFGILEEVSDKTTITYDKFMELFAEPKYEVKYIAEQPNDFKQITDSIASLLQYKNEKYGNSALEPLNVFQGKSKVGQRLDDKLARVKNNNTLQKNDVADLIGYLFLVCKENNWTNFDEFKD